MPSIFKDIRVVGSVDVCHNHLKDLSNSPEEVSGWFDCSFNKKLVSLRGAPRSVGSFSCYYTLIQNVEGAPSNIAGHFVIRNCFVNSLKGCPKIVGKDFNVEHNRLATLVGGAEHVGADFYARYNPLTTLDGFPKIVEGDVLLSTYLAGPQFTTEDVRKLCKVGGGAFIYREGRGFISG